MPGYTDDHQMRDNRMHAGQGCACCAGGATAGSSRRHVLRTGLAAAGLAAFGGGLGPRTARAQTTLSPGAALDQMMAGNRRFVARQLTSFTEDLDMLKQNTVAKQEPFAAVLSCADSRVPVELIFDQSIGHLFVTRVAGNVASTEMIASLEYGAAVLGTRAILVLGHGGCGAVKATIDGKAVPGQISALYAPLRAAVDAAGSDLTAAIKANAQIQARLLADASPVLGGLVKDGKLKIAAGYYDLAGGQVTLLE
jgi:carbonic anhydrase